MPALLTSTSMPPRRCGGIGDHGRDIGAITHIAATRDETGQFAGNAFQALTSISQIYTRAPLA